MTRPKIAITIGDPHGIGPEVVLKSLSAGPRDYRPVLVGPVGVWKYHAGMLDMSGISLAVSDDFAAARPEAPAMVNTKGSEGDDIRLGMISRQAGSTAMRAIGRAVDLCRSGSVDGMVTAPISKEAVRLAGYDIPGHTEFIAARTDTDSFAMMMVAKGLRVALATTHCPVQAIAAQITRDLLRDKLQVLEATLRRDFAVDHPSIAVLGLNPHAGDGGMIGREEIDAIAPVVNGWEESKSTVEGPFPADAFFGRHRYSSFDAVLAMYHDQGLVSFKTLHSNEGINFTAGLPIVRTSPDHGTAFDIAGEGIAVADSMINAIGLAVDIARRRGG